LPRGSQLKEEDLFKAAESGDASIFNAPSPQQLSESLSFRNEDGRSFLHVAASAAHPDVVRKILAETDGSGSVINSKDEGGWAPLHSAASIGNADIVEALLS
ncbi:hypothetical protein Dimus_030704, partial [Dionaea muscipula]